MGWLDKTLFSLFILLARRWFPIGTSRMSRRRTGLAKTGAWGYVDVKGTQYWEDRH